jgi:diguanylate cyclase (GGDEF)-like protein
VVTSVTVALVFLGEFARLSYRFAQLAAVDPLTGLANRRSFDERLEEGLRAFMRTGEPLTLLMIDVDDFKRFNDTYGHVAGDGALRAIADAIRDVVNRPRDVVARYGGEEFVIVLSDTPLEGALSVAERIRIEVVRRRIPHKANRAAPYVTVSLGAASARGGSPDARELIERADTALYRAKDAGRNRVEADPSPRDAGVRAETGSAM